MEQSNNKFPSKISSSKFTSTNPSGNKKDSTNRNNFNLNNHEERQPNAQFIDKVVNVQYNPTRDSKTLEILKMERQKRAFEVTKDEPPSSCNGFSQIFVHSKQQSMLKIIQEHLTKLNLKVGQNEGHGNPLQDNSQEIPLWLICRGSYS